MKRERKLTVDGESDGRLFLDGGGGVDLHVRWLLVRGLRHGGGCGGGPAAECSDAVETKGSGGGVRASVLPKRFKPY